MKKARWFFLVLILMILLIPAGLFQRAKNYYSDIDNRNLAELSSPTDFDTLTRELKTYTNERIGLRNEMIYTYNLLNMKLFGVFSHPDYELGKNGEFFPDIIENQYYDAYRQTFVTALDKMNKYCEARGIKFYLLFDPNKISIYPENMPEGVNYTSQWVEDFFHGCDEIGLTYINNYEYFKEIKDEVKLYNSKEDVTHWNDMGAFLGCNHALRVIQKDFPAVEENRLEDMEVGTELIHTLQNSNYVIDETVPKIEMETTWVNQGEAEGAVLQKDSTFANFAHFVTTNEADKVKPKIMAFEGSYMYGGNHHAFLIRQSSEYITIHNYRNVLNLPYYVNVFQPDLVIFDVAEFVFAEYFFPSSIMGNMIYMPGLSELNYPEEALESLQVEITEFTPEYKRIYADVNTTEYPYAYVEFNGKVYDMEILDNRYHLITLSANLSGADRLKFYFADENAKVIKTAEYILP